MNKYLLAALLMACFSWLGLNAQNNCLEFDGADDYVNCGTINLSGSQITLEAWIKPESFQSSSPYIKNIIGEEGTGSSAFLRLGDASLANNKLQFVLWIDGAQTKLDGVTALSDNEWYHVAATYDGSHMRIYTNGIEDASQAQTGSFTANSTFYLSPPAVDCYFDGLIDEVRVWDDLRSETEIRQNMHRELPDPSSETNLVAYYELNETSGTTAVDSKNSYDGTLTNYEGQTDYWQTSPAMSGPKNCLDFDGTNEYVEIPNSGTGVLGDNSDDESFTIETWFKYVGSGNFNEIFAKHSTWGGYFMEQYNSNYLKIGFRNTSLNWITVNGTKVVNDGAWHHLVFVYDNTDDRSISFYIDGELQGTADNFIPAQAQASVYLCMMRSQTWDGYTAGQLDEFRVWNDVRTEQEIRENMCKSLTGNENNLVAYYNFNNTSGITLQDFSGNENDGTLTNMEGSDWVASYTMVLAEDATDKAETSFIAHWDCPGSNSSFDDGYTIEYSESADFSGSSTSTALSSETSKTITGLTSSTSYYYHVSGKRSGSSTLEYSNVKSLTTASGPLAPANCLDFDGSNYVSVASNFGLTSTLTVECWVNIPTTSEKGIFVDIGGDAGGYGIGVGNGTIDVAGNELIVRMDQIAWQPTGDNIGTGWHHVAYSFNGTNLEVYLDGVNVLSSTSAYNNPATNSTYIGARDASGGMLTNGKIDELRIWSTVRSATDIGNNMTSLLEGDETGIKAYYRFDDGSGTILSDETSNGYDGTLINSPFWINSYAMVLAEDATDIASRSFTANWDCPQINSSFDDGYTIQYSTTSDFSSGNITTTALSSETSKSIIGLTASTSYYYHVSGKRTGSSTLEYSKVKNLTTTNEPGAPAYCLDFDGIDQYVEIPNSGTGVLGDNSDDESFTIETWFKYAGSGNFNEIFAKHTYGSGYFMEQYNSNYLKIGFANTSAEWTEVNGTKIVNDGAWHHLVFVYDNSGNKSISFFIDGELQGTASNFIPGQAQASVNLCMMRSQTWGAYTAGHLDEFRVWNDVRTEQEILENMCKSLAGNESNLLAYYNFDNTPGTTLQDFSGNENDGTLENMENSDWVVSYAMVLAEDATDITKTSFTANWDCPGNNSSFNDGYTIEYSTNSDFSSGNATSTASGSETNKSITGLTASTNYYYHVGGKSNGSSTLEYSNVKSFTTAIGSPAPANCLDFDGSNYVSVASNFDLTSTVTVECWVNIPSTSEKGMFVDIGGDAGGYGIGVGDGSIDLAGNELIVRMDQIAWQPTGDNIGTSWHHVAFSFNGINLEVYLDGVNVLSSTPAYTNPATNFTYIGARDASGGILTNGKIDELRIWSTVRSATDIGNNMTSPLEGDETGLTAYYRFDDGSGTTLSDETSNGNDGTLINSPSWINSYAMVLAENASDIASRSFTANWDCPINSSFDDGYTIQYSTTSDFSSGNATATAFNSETSKSITGLAPSTSYYYHISGKRSGLSTLEYSNIKSLTTASEPEAPANCLDFDGIDQYVEIPNSGTGVLGDNSSNESFTIETWFKYAGSGNFNEIFAKHSLGGGYFMEQNESDYLKIGFRNESMYWTTVNGTKVVNDGVWHHLVFVYDNSGNRSISFYIDGELQGTASDFIPEQADASVNLCMMRSQTWGGYTAGRLDEFRVWNDVRTEQEIRENMCQTLVGDEENLVAYYNCNSSSGTTLYDISGNEYNGSLENGTTWASSNAFNTWLNRNSTSWATAVNWSLGSVPSATDNVGIPYYSDLSQPTLSSALNCNELVLGEGSTLTFDYAGSHTIHGSAFVIGRSDIRNGSLLTVTKSLYMTPFATLNIKPGGELTIEANLEADFGTFTIESDANRQGSMIVEGTSSGDVIVQRYLTRGKWHYISAPVNDTRVFNTFLDLTGGANNDQFYWWDEDGTDNGSTGIWFDILNDPTGASYTVNSFLPSQGYAITYAGIGSETINFSGVPYTEDKTITITKTDASSNPGANLVGNPFTSTIALNSGDNNFIADNGSLFDAVYGGVYLWNEQANFTGDRNDYHTVSLATGTEFASPGQGFMIVKKDIGTSAINFNANIRQHGSATFYKNNNHENVSRVKLSVKGADNLINTTTIAFLVNMTLGLDPLYDAGKFKGNPNIALYTKLINDNGQDFAIQALPDQNIEDYIIPIGVDVAESGVFEFSAMQENLDNYSLLLEDRQQNTFTNLRWDTYFANISESGIGRFYLHFKDATAIGEITPETKVTFRYLDGKIVINNPDNEKGILSLVNVSGQVLSNFEMNGDPVQEFSVSQAAGIYILSFTTKQAFFGRKLFIR